MLGNHEVPRFSFGIPWFSLVFLWLSLIFVGFPRFSLVSFGFPWFSLAGPSQESRPYHVGEGCRPPPANHMRHRASRDGVTGCLLPLRFTVCHLPFWPWCFSSKNLGLGGPSPAAPPCAPARSPTLKYSKTNEKSIFSAQNLSKTTCNLPTALWKRQKAFWSRPKGPWRTLRCPSARARGVRPASKLVLGYYWEPKTIENQ